MSKNTVIMIIKIPTKIFRESSDKDSFVGRFTIDYWRIRYYIACIRKILTDNYAENDAQRNRDEKNARKCTFFGWNHAKNDSAPIYNKRNNKNKI